MNGQNRDQDCDQDCGQDHDQDCNCDEGQQPNSQADSQVKKGLNIGLGPPLSFDEPPEEGASVTVRTSALLPGMTPVSAESPGVLEAKAPTALAPSPQDQKSHPTQASSAAPAAALYHESDSDAERERQREIEREVRQLHVRAKLVTDARQSIVAPFINRHKLGSGEEKRTYCYRHHPDVTCNQQADATMARHLEDKLDQLDHETDREAIRTVWALFRAAPSSQRMMMMQGLLTQCCFPQLSAVSSLVKELIRIDFLSALPVEISFKILMYLDSASLCRAAQVCKYWKQLADDDVVWHRMCEQHIDKKCTKCGWGLPLLEKKRLRDAKRAMEARASGKHLDDEAALAAPIVPAQGPVSAVSVGQKRPAEDDAHGTTSSEAGSSTAVAAAPQKRPKTRPWKEVYAERYRIERNWRRGKYRMQEFKDTSSVLCLQFDEQYLATGTHDGKVKVWDIETGELVRVLEGHVRAVSALKFDSTKLISGSWDRTVRIWNYRTGECVCTFRGHEADVLCLDFNQTLIASGSADHNVRIWNFEEKSCFTLRGHKEPVHSVRLHSSSGTVYSASEDLTVRMWNLETKTCLRVFGEQAIFGHVAQIQQVLPLTLDHLEDNEADASNNEEGLEGDTENTTTNTNTNTTVTTTSPTAIGPTAPAAAIPDDRSSVRPTHLLTCSLDNTIKLWDIGTGKCVRTLFGHFEGVWCIAADTFRIVSGGHDKLVKVWDLQSGKCWHTFKNHVGPVCCVGLSDTRFASGADDGIVRMYRFDE